MEKVIRAVIQYSNSQLLDTMYTWQGVNNALLRDSLASQREERKKAEQAKKAAEVETAKLKDSLNEEEKRIKDLLLSALTDALSNMPEKSRRADVIRDIIENNDYQKKSEKRESEVKRLLRDYSGITGKLRQELEELGFVITEDGKHYKITYYGDERYQAVFGKTPSDVRSGKNNVAMVAKIFY